MKSAFSCFVFGHYIKFIPYYIFSIRKNYPNADILIFTEEKLPKKITLLFNENVFFISDAYNKTDYDLFINYNIKGGYKKLLRHILSSKYFMSYDLVYFGDVDILILKEQENLFNFHQTIMQSLNLPFSNKIRFYDSEQSTKRLTGLYCVNPKEYYPKIDLILTKLINDKIFRESLLSKVSRDEHFLYHLLKTAFNFNDTDLLKVKRPWHGLHLGITRGNKKLDLKTIEENSSISLNEIKEQLLVFQKDKDFIKIQKNFYLIEYHEILKQLKMPISIEWKIKAYKNKAISYFKALKKIKH